MRRFGMCISPLATALTPLLVIHPSGLQEISAIALAASWFMVEMLIAVKQEYRTEIPRNPWVTTSRVLWLLSVFFYCLDIRFCLVPLSMPVPLAWTALILLCAGLAIRLAAFLTLGKYFTYDVAVRGGQSLVTRGIYGIIRHPAYLAICLLGTLTPLALGSVAGFILQAVFTIPQTLFRLRREEEILERSFGDEFDRYRQRTWALVPFVY